MIKNDKGITIIALIVTIIVLIIIAGISIAALTSDNGVLRQTNAAKVTQIESTAREQMDLACSAVRLAIAEASAKDNSYKANENAGLIQGVLKNMLEKDSQGLESTGWKTGTVDAANGKFTITYEGQDYKNACNDTEAEITYTITLGQKSIEVTDIGTGIKGPNGSDTLIDIGGENISTPSSKKIYDKAQIGQYVNYDPTDVSQENESKTTYTSLAGNTSTHGNGATKQIFSATAYKAEGLKWQILEKNADGTVTLISDLIYRDNVTSGVSNGTMSSKTFQIKEGIGYMYAEEELHRIGAIYGYGYGADTDQTVTYYYGGPNDQNGSIPEIDADNDGIVDNLVELQQGRKGTLDLDSGGRAITLEDVNRISGKTLKYTVNYSEGTVAKTDNNAKYYPTLVNAADTSTGKSAEVLTPNGNYYNTDYQYTISSIHSDSTVAESQNTLLKLSTAYWIASRCAFGRSNHINWGVYTISTSGNNVDNSVAFCQDGEWTYTTGSNPVRALVTLKAEIETVDDVYNEATGWNLK